MNQDFGESSAPLFEPVIKLRSCAHRDGGGCACDGLAQKVLEGGRAWANGRQRR
jgi:hypothetical protein